MTVAVTPSESDALSAQQASLLRAAFPDARVLSVIIHPEPWMPFERRVRLALPDGDERTVDVRTDIDPALAALLPALDRLGIPGPRPLSDTVPDGRGGYVTLAKPPHGENLLLWALGGTPHRIRIATERAFESIDRLQGITDALLADPAAASLPRRTLADEAALLPVTEPTDGDDWRGDAWFRDALARASAAVADIRDPLVYTDYVHFFPNFVRIAPSPEPTDSPLGWPGDPRLGGEEIAEYVTPRGHFGDPLLGLAMVWVYDCYPFVHTGFVEQFLWRRGVSRREFAPRLALRTLMEVQRALPLVRPAGDAGRYHDALRGWVEQGLAWL